MYVYIRRWDGLGLILCFISFQRTYLYAVKLTQSR